MEPNYIEIGKRLQMARKQANLTQQALADSLGFSVSYIKNIERGKKPSIEYLLAAADKCQANAEWLLTGNQAQNIPQQKSEAVFDPATRDMIEAIKLMMSDPDPDVRVWAKVQFRRTFADYLDAAIEKKEHA